MTETHEGQIRAGAMKSEQRAAMGPVMSDLVIRKATPRDVEDILVFLKEEYEELSTGDGFWGNRNIIRRTQASDELEVLSQRNDLRVLAFCVWSLCLGSMDIIEVRPGCRGRGLGRYLTQYVLDQLRSRDFIGVEIQCMPEESLLVWQKMGFQRIEKKGWRGTYAVYLFQRERECPKNVETRQIEIHLIACGKALEPAFCCQGVIEGTKYVLQTDFVAYLPDPEATELQVHVDGCLMYSDSAKYSTDVGVERKGNFVRCRELDVSQVKCSASGQPGGPSWDNHGSNEVVQ
jgi:GNAT superfamily N-acetyltransferase